MSYNGNNNIELNYNKISEYNKLKAYYEEHERKKEKRRLLYMLKKYGSIENGTKKQRVF